MTLEHAHLIQQLQQLSCFENIDSIARLTKGDSHPSFKVTTKQGGYFAKYFANICDHNYEVNIIDVLAKKKLTPSLLTTKNHWLISRFVDENTLSFDDKLAQLLSALATLHRLPVCDFIDVKPINFQQVLNELISQNRFESHIRSCINEAKEQLLASLPSMSLTDLTLCHGDANINNILICKSSNKSYLIDFESVCLAPVEYELGMLMAINLLTHDKIDTLVSSYQNINQYTTNITLNNVTRYLNLSLFINMLWYKAKASATHSQHYYVKAKQQLNMLINNNILPQSFLLPMR